jgi:hypothetical protein
VGMCVRISRSLGSFLGGEEPTARQRALLRKCCRYLLGTQPAEGPEGAGKWQKASVGPADGL